MDRIWQRVWDRYGKAYWWAGATVTFLLSIPIYFVFISLPIIVFEMPGRLAPAAVATVAAAALLVSAVIGPDRGLIRPAEQWAAGGHIDRASALAATYTYSRRTSHRAVWATGVWAAALAVTVAVIVQAPVGRLVQYALVAATLGIAVQLIAFHSIMESALRPVRMSLIGDLQIGDDLPHPVPTFATRSNVSMVAVAFGFGSAGALLSAPFESTRSAPIICIAIGFALTLLFAVPISVSFGFSPSLQPIRDLAEGAERVAAGHFSRRLPVVQDDDLGALAASFNRMQAGLAERQRLQGAFGTYVDPVLAARLLKQSDDVFAGERRTVTVMFVDVRDFTAFAESHTAEDTVARLNALFGIVVPAVVSSGGHVNKFLGDGALAVFGAPNDLTGHADAALHAAVSIHRSVSSTFGDSLRIGIGINTGTVIAGTIGGGGKLEFTLIGDTVNVAARVEALTKATGDTLLFTEGTVAATATPPSDLISRGSHRLKGKAAPVAVYSLRPGV